MSANDDDYDGGRRRGRRGPGRGFESERGAFSGIERVPVPGKATLTERLPMAHPAASAIRAVRGAHGAATRIEAWAPRLAERIAAGDYLESGRLSFEIRSAIRTAEAALAQLERDDPRHAAIVATDIATARDRLAAITRELAILLRAAPVLEAAGAGSEERERDWRARRSGVTVQASTAATADEAIAPTSRPTLTPAEYERAVIAAGQRGAAGEDRWQAAARVAEQAGLAGSGAVDRGPSWADDAAALAPRLGLGTVEIRSDDTARGVTEANAARGVALGGTVYLHPDRIQPGTPEGREVLAHELIHLAQAQLPAAHDAGRDAAEQEAAAVAPVLARGGAVPQLRCAIDLGRAAADRDAPTAPVDLGDYDSKLGESVQIVRARRATRTSDLSGRRKELQELLSTETDLSRRAAARREYEAIQYVADERNIPAPHDPEEQAATVGAGGVRWWSPTTPEGMRAFIERKIAEKGSYSFGRAYAWGLVNSPITAATKQQLDTCDVQAALLDLDADAFRHEFRTQATRVAVTMLDESSVTIDKVLRSYGIAGGVQRMTRAARAVAADPSALDGQVDEWIAISKTADGNRSAYQRGVGERADLAKSVALLAAHQRAIQDLTQSKTAALKAGAAREHAGHHRADPLRSRPRFDNTTPIIERDYGAAGRSIGLVAVRPLPQASSQPSLAAIDLELHEAKQALASAWVAAERDHPILVAFRAGVQLEDAQLNAVTGDDATTRQVVTTVLPKLANILTCKAALGGDLDALTLGPVVELTRQRMFVPPGSYRAGVVTDLVHDAASERSLVRRALDAIQLVLTLAQFVPGVGLLGRAAMVATDQLLELYQAGLELSDHDLRSAATNTDLDRARSLSDQEPALTGFAMHLILAGLDGLALTSLFKEAVALRRMAIAGEVDDAAVRALNAAGEAHGVGQVGDDIVANARREVPAVGPAGVSLRATEAAARRIRSAAEEQAAQRLRNGASTIEAYTVGRVPAGDAWDFLGDPANWLPERRALHEQLLDRAEAEARAFADAMEGPAAIHATRGNTAVGKTRAIKGNIPDLDDAIEATKSMPHRAVNPDNFKVDLMAADPDLALTSTQLHMESSVLAHRLQQRLLTLKRSDGQLGSILIDKRLGQLRDVEELADMAKQTGRKLQVHDVDAPLEVSLYGVLMRKPGGADPIPNFKTIRDGFVAARKNRKAVIEVFVNDPSLGTYEVFETMASGAKRRVASVTNGRLEVVDSTAFEALVADPGAVVEKLAARRITQQDVDVLTAGMPADFGTEVRTVLSHAVEEGQTWQQVVDAHAAAKPGGKP